MRDVRMSLSNDDSDDDEESFSLEQRDCFWDNIDDNESVTSMSYFFKFKSWFIWLTFLVSVSEMKIWFVPQMDSRNVPFVRHKSEFAFSGVEQKDLPIFILSMKNLWDKCFNNDSQQQPTRPASVAPSTPFRFLNHSTIKSGWSHLFSSFYQMCKVWWSLCHKGKKK